MEDDDLALNLLHQTCSYSLYAATQPDFDFVYSLKKLAYKEYVEQTWGWDEAFQLKFQKENFAEGHTKIIKANGIPIGSVDLKEGEFSVFISGLYLLPDYQSKGIGSKIINDLFKETKTKNKRLELEVLKVNKRAIKLYKRLGFTMEDRR